MTIPPEAITAAYAAYQKAWLTHNQANPLFAEHVVCELLEAAAPLIAAAERDRIVGLIERQASEAAPDYAHTLRKLADLLRGDQP